MHLCTCMLLQSLVHMPLSKMPDKETGIKYRAESSSDHDVQLGNVAIDPAKEKKLLRKLDLCICPLVMSIFLVAYLDRSNLG